MSPKALLMLAVITVIATAGAVYAVLNQPTTTALQFVDEPAFPSLRETPDAVAKITVTTPDGSITLVRETGDRWAALERYGYPVDSARVRALVVALADMRLIERKTAQPEHYDRLQVEDPGSEDAHSQLVRLEAADGTVLAEAIIGKQRTRLTGTEPSGTYLRRPGEAVSWLASGGVEIADEVKGWLDDQIVDLNTRSIAQIAIEPEGGPGYTLERARPDDDWRMTDLGADETLVDDPDFTRLSGALSGVRLEDVKPRDQLSWPGDSSRARVATFDGLEMTVRLAQIDNAYWATFDAQALGPSGSDAADPAAADAQAGSPEETSAAAATAETTTAESDSVAPRPEDDTSAEGVEEVSLEETDASPDPAELDRRLGKWAFQIPEYLYNRLTTSRSEFLKDDDGTS
jgi:hypothetical protein